MPITRSILYFCMAIAAVGCSTDKMVSPPVSAPSASATLLQTLPASITLLHPPVRQQFDPLVINASAGIRVGTPVQITVASIVNFSTSGARLDILVPQVSEIGFRQKYGLNKRGPISAAPQLTWNGAASRASTINRNVSVVFPVPGTYVINAAIRSSDQGFDSAGYIQTVREAVAWIVVTKDSGWVIHSFKDAATHQQAVANSDPVSAYLAQPSMASNVVTPMTICPQNSQTETVGQAQPNICTDPPPPPPANFSGILVYYNARFNQTIALANARMAIFDSRGGGFAYQVQTDRYGNFSLPCPSPTLRVISKWLLPQTIPQRPC